jgi:putative membrane protein insertion efficiency factor
LSGSCRFEPTCSSYSYEAIERFGISRGGWLTLLRLLRCQPFSGRFGFDPVPETWEELRLRRLRHHAEVRAGDDDHSAFAAQHSSEVRS